MKKNIKPKGFGFGDAMFAVKVLQNQYAMIDDVPPQKIVPPFAVVRTEKTNVLPVNKPVVTKNVVQKTYDPMPNKGGFKINPGKEFQVELHFLKLTPMPICEKVSELSSDGKGGKWEYNVFCEGQSVEKYVSAPEVTFNFTANRIKQGQLGNCYFVCALASLAHIPRVLQQRIPESHKYGPKDKIFKVNMFESGKCIQMPVENMFTKVYCQPVGNDVSPMILEKAFAQVYGNYEVIVLGHASDALRDLTGAPTAYIDLKDKTIMEAQIMQAFEKKYPLVIASKQVARNQSISMKHSYNVLDVKKHMNELFLKLRDPRGWTKAEFNSPKQFQCQFQNGQFWVSVNDLNANFEVISVCKASPDYNYFFKAFNSKQIAQSRGGFIVTVQQKGKGYFSIHQKHKKFFSENFKYDIVRILLARVDTENKSMSIIETVNCCFNAQAFCFIEADLEPGQYLVLGQMGSRGTKDRFMQQIFTLSMYTVLKPVRFEQLVGKIQVKTLLSNYIRNHREEFKETVSDKGLYRYHGALFGYMCIYYQNKGSKLAREELQYVSQNIEIYEKKVQVGPNETHLIMNPIGSQNNCSHQCSFKAKTFYQ